MMVILQDHFARRQEMKQLRDMGVIRDQTDEGIQKVLQDKMVIKSKDGDKKEERGKRGESV